MKIEFELVVKVTGDSLQDVDNGLVQAAGERLKARIQNYPKEAIGAHSKPAGFNVVTEISETRKDD